LFIQAELLYGDTKIPVSPVYFQNREMMPLVGDRTVFVQRAYSSEETEFPDYKGVFAFSDLSVRQEGIYRLRFSLFEIIGVDVFFRGEIVTLPFKTYTPKRFPGMQSSTEATADLKRNGIRMRWKKSIRVDPKKLEANKVKNSFIQCPADANILQRQQSPEYLITAMVLE
jgi:Velvet factor